MSHLTSISLGVLVLFATPEMLSASAESPFDGISTDDLVPVNAESRLSGGSVLIPRTLDRDGLAEGFAGVSVSVSQCMSRHLKLQDKGLARKVEVRLTVARDGKVSRMKLPQRVRKTTFGVCMRAHSGRWRFPQFTGKPIRVKKKFILN